MELLKAEKLAKDLMKKYDLLSWGFEFDNAKRRFGRCSHRSKVISLSRNLVSINDESRVKDTILHEIAHALVGCNHGHDSVWKRKALEIGCSANRCYTSDNTVIPKSKYFQLCTTCGKTYNRHRKTKSNTSCGVCSPKKYNEKYKLVFRER